MVKNYWISTPYSAGNIGVVVNKANILGKLETPFQDPPLDLCENTFYQARKDLIEARLAEIRDGKVSMRNYILGPNIF